MFADALGRRRGFGVWFVFGVVAEFPGVFEGVAQGQMRSFANVIFVGLFVPIHHRLVPPDRFIHLFVPRLVAPVQMIQEVVYLKLRTIDKFQRPFR